MRRSLHRESTRQFLDDFVPDKANVSAVVIARKRDLREGRGEEVVRAPDRAAQGRGKSRGESVEGKSADWKRAIGAELKRRGTVPHRW